MCASSARHVALFLPSLRGGGAERAMLDIAGGFAANGDVVDLVLVNAEGPYLELVPRYVKIVDLGLPRVAKSLPGLIRYLRQYRPEVLLSTPSRANVIAVCARMLAMVPLRLFIREATTMSQSLRYDSRLNAWKRLQLVRCLYPQADKIVAVSQGVANDLHNFAKLPTNKIKVIYNPVVTPELSAKADHPVDHPWFQSGQPPVILGVGRLSRAKNFAMLIRAFSQRGLCQRAHLMILGEGDQRLELERLVSELGLGATVCLPGFVNNPFAFMARSALCVLSSVQEGFPNVIVQAMAVGTPVVATDCLYGPAEILEGGRLGRLTPVDSVEAMSQAIDEELASNSKQDASLRLRLMERANCFSQERSISSYSSIFFGNCQEH